MKKYTILLLFSLISIFTVESQNINQLMNGYDNKFALEHMELYTKEENKNYRGHTRSNFHKSIKVVNVDATWLDTITDLIEQDPAIMYSYLDTSNTQNLAAYILLASIFNIDMPEPGSGSNTFDELVDLNVLKSDTPQEDIDEYAERTSIPAGQDPFEHMMNAEWGEIAIPNGVNARLKTAIENR